MRIRRIVVLFYTLFILQIALSGCRATMDVSKEREALAQKDDKNITIAIAGQLDIQEAYGYLDGITMAVDEINKDGGINNRKFEIRKFDDKGITVEGIQVANELANNPEIAAVIGHWNSHVTLPVAKIYDDSELLMLTGMITTPELTQSDYKYIFRNIPNDGKLSEEMAKAAKRLGHKRMAIYYADTDYGKALANSFEDFAGSMGIKIVDRTTDDHSLDRTFNKWKALDFDGVFIADHIPSANEFMLRFKEVFPQIPILGTNGLDTPDFFKVLGPAAEGTVMASLYDPNDDNPKLKEFAEKFKGKYGKDPNVYAVQGYETIKLLADALTRAKNPTPQETMKALRTMKQWTGLTGTLTVEENGDVTGKVIYLKTVKNGKFVYLPDIR